MLDQMTLDPSTLRAAFGCLPTGVSVVSLLNEEGAPTGVTVGSFTSLSLDPALCLFSLGRSQASARLFETGTPFVVNVLGGGMQQTAWQFAKPARDKCAGIELADTVSGAPRLADALAHFSCRTHAIHDGGDHVIVVGEILSLGHSKGDALVFYRGQMHPARSA